MSTFARDEIVFIGTSNSLRVEGYTVPLKQSYDRSANYALGASAYTLLALQADRLRSHRGASIVIDLAVTDQYIGDVVYVDPALHRHAFEGLLGDCAAGANRPYILIMPSIWDRCYNGPTRALYHKYSNDYSIPIFDGFKFIERLYKVRPDLEKYGYEPGTHLDNYLARMLGRCLDQAIEIAALQGQTRCLGREGRWQTASFSPVGLSDDPRTIAYENSLGSRQVVRLSPGESATFEIPDDHEIIGYAVNAMSSWGYLRLHGDRVVTKDLRNGWVMEGERLILTAWTFARPIRPVDGLVQAECLLNPDTGEDVEPSDIPFKGKVRPTFDKIELCALLTLAPSGPETRITFDGPLDLVALISDAALEAASRVEFEPPFVPRPDAVRIGSDGVPVTIPRGYSFREGRDGRIVPLPPGSIARIDPEGRAFVVTADELQLEAARRERQRIEHEQRREEHRKQIEAAASRRREVEEHRLATRKAHEARLAEVAKHRQNVLAQREINMRARQEHAERIARQRLKVAAKHDGAGE